LNLPTVLRLWPHLEITGHAEEADSKAETKLRKQIADYCKALVAALPLPKPSGGDCWYCYFREQETGLPLGEVNKDTDHLKSHLEDNYFVPSLVWRALEFNGLQPTGRRLLLVLLWPLRRVALGTLKPLAVSLRNICIGNSV